MQKSLAELSQTRVKKLEDNVFRKVCEVFGFDRLNKHQEEILRFVFEFGPLWLQKVDLFL